MKLLTLLTLLVFAAPFGWGEELDWPLEFTCVTPSDIFHLHLSGETETSWVRPLSAYDGIDEPFKKKQIGQKVYKIKDIDVETSHLRVRMASGFGSTRGHNLWIISRFTPQMHNAFKTSHGTCELGVRDLESFKRAF